MAAPRSPAAGQPRRVRRLRAIRVSASRKKLRHTVHGQLCDREADKRRRLAGKHRPVLHKKQGEELRASSVGRGVVLIVPPRENFVRIFAPPAVSPILRAFAVVECVPYDRSRAVLVLLLPPSLPRAACRSLAAFRPPVLAPRSKTTLFLAFCEACKRPRFLSSVSCVRRFAARPRPRAAQVTRLASPEGLTGSSLSYSEYWRAVASAVRTTPA